LKEDEMAHATARRDVPRSALIGAGALIAFSIATAAVGRWTGVGAVHADDGAPVQASAFRVADRADGGISVIAPESGAVVAVVPAGTDGFIRTVLRSLAFDRARHGVGSGPAFVLTRWSDGRSTLDDPATGRRVDLAAFGPASAQTFARLLPPRGGSS
jgi:putative photosynthetic complex assembly protein